MGNEIMKRTIREGAGDIAVVGVTVTCNFKGYFGGANGAVADKSKPFETFFNQKFKIGEGDCFPGLELTLRHAKVGELFEAMTKSKFAYGLAGRVSFSMQDPTLGTVEIPEIPPNTDLLYEVEVLSHLQDDQFDLESLRQCGIKEQDINTEDNTQMKRLHALNNLILRKECGNRWYLYQDYSRASKAYSKATQIADHYFKTNSESESTNSSNSELIANADRPLVDTYIACLNNLAACHINKNEFLKAKDMCVRVLEFDPRNVKALLRAAKATLALDVSVQ